MCKRCDLCMKAKEIKTVNGTQGFNDGLSLDKGPLKALENGL